MCRRGRMDHEGLRIAHICKVACKSQTIDDLASSMDIAFDTEAQHAAESIRPQEFLGTFMITVALEAQI
jgi:hypothetical protein